MTKLSFIRKRIFHVLGLVIITFILNGCGSVTGGTCQGKAQCTGYGTCKGDAICKGEGNCSGYGTCKAADGGFGTCKGKGECRGEGVCKNPKAESTCNGKPLVDGEKCVGELICDGEMTCSVGEGINRKSTRLNSSHSQQSRMPSSA